MILHYPFLFFIFFSLFPEARAQELSPGITAAYRKLLEFKTDSLDHFLEVAHPTQHDSAFKTYIRSLECFLKLMIAANDSLYQFYPEREKIFLDELASLEKDDPFTLFVKGEIRLHSGIIRYRYGDFFTAGIRFMQASGLVRSVIRSPEPPGYIYKTSGILNILLSLVPDQYNLLLRLFGLNADLNLGIKQLEKVVETEDLFRFEGTMVLAFLNAYYLDQTGKSSAAVRGSYEKWQNSLLYWFLAGLIEAKVRNNEEALKAFSACLEFSPDYYLIPSVRFYLAETLLNKLDLAAAKKAYEQFLSNDHSEDFRKTANYRLYLIHFLENDSLSAEKYRRNVLNSGRLFTETDKYVHTLVKNDHRPHPEILKARLLFDGGYYGRSLAMLEKVDQDLLPNDEVKLEYLYRKGRVYQELKDYEPAISSFQKMFNFDVKENYLVASARLQMGYIELERKNLEKAASYFREAMKYSGEYYRNSIRNEARAGLRLVE